MAAGERQELIRQQLGRPVTVSPWKQINTGERLVTLKRANTTSCPVDVKLRREVAIRLSGQPSEGKFTYASGRLAVKVERCNGRGHQPPVTDM
jgi:hypothetical protein